MKFSEQSYKAFKSVNCCVIIPTYNNDKTLAEVIDKVLFFTDQIIIVNDGSDDTTKSILNSYRHLTVIHTEQNSGKGVALKQGFVKALSQKYQYAVTIDSDMQHLPSDLPKFIQALEKNPDSVIVGARNMDQNHIPKKSSFGHHFSNFWFAVETGVKIPDTQSGYRLYPLELFKTTKYFSWKYEFEIEILVRAAWKKVNIISIPVHVVYQTGDGRVTHFRPIADFARASLLNTILVPVALLYMRPKNFIRGLTLQKIKDLVKKNILATDESNLRITLAVALGFFMGITPIWGYQLIVALALSALLKLNKSIVVLSTNISLPPLIPFIIYGSYKIGGLITPAGNTQSVTLSSDIDFTMIKNNMLQYITGSIFLAIIVSLIGSISILLLLNIFRKNAKN